MTIDIPENATMEEKLLQLTDMLESIKTTLEEIIDEMDSDGKDIGSLEEASEAVDDAIDAIGDAVDELEEEELELDEEYDEDEDPDVPDGIGVGITIG